MVDMIRWFFIFTLVLLQSCADEGPKEPVSADPAFAEIDPDKKALPKDTQVSANGAADSTPSPSQVDPAVESAPLAEVPPSPRVDEVVGATQGRSISAPSTSDVSSAPVSATGSGTAIRYIKAFEINIRSQPNRHSKIVGRLRGGDEVRVSIHGGWSKLDDGRWIRSRWLVKNPPKSFSHVSPDEEGRPQKNKKVRQNKRSKRSKKDSKS
jgi:hypothetical protein